MEAKKPLGFSFKMSKKPENKIFKANVEKEEEKTEYVTCINDNIIESSAPKVEKTDLVIPLITNNNWRVNREKRKNVNSAVENNSDGSEIDVKEMTNEEKLEEMAKKALLKEAEVELESRDTKKDIYSTRIVPLLMQNRVPEGYETDDKLDVSLRAAESTLEDYEKVPVEEFGYAMLRGMGWKPGEGVGKNSKVVEPVEVKIRPKGLGLGAELLTSKKQVASSVPKQEEELVLKIHAYVCVEMGDFAGVYGQVEALDDELSRATIRPAISGTSFSVPTAALRLVGRKEYQMDGKVINKSKYDEYKSRREKVIHSHRKDRRAY